eukprot:3680165-Amphidinium_carterae.1
MLFTEWIYDRFSKSWETLCNHTETVTDRNACEIKSVRTTPPYFVRTQRWGVRLQLSDPLSWGQDAAVPGAVS